MPLKELDNKLSFSVETPCDIEFSTLMLSTIVSKAESERELAVSRLCTENAFFERSLVRSSNKFVQFNEQS